MVVMPVFIAKLQCHGIKKKAFLLQLYEYWLGLDIETDVPIWFHLHINKGYHTKIVDTSDVEQFSIPMSIPQLKTN